MFDRLSFDFRGHHVEGKCLVVGLAIFTTLFVLKKYFSGGRCRIEKDMKGEIAVITGANTGIGKETARKLADLGCMVIFGARDMDKNEQTKKELQKTAKAEISYFKLDLGQKQSIQNFTKRVVQKLDGRPINYLINNAGVMTIPQRKTTKDGFEMQIGVNHFGHFYLTYLLWKNLKASGNPRIINVSSLAHKERLPETLINFDDIHFENGYAPYFAYSRSKKANVLFTKQLQNKMDAAKLDGISISLHPGLVRTELTRYMLDSIIKKIFFKLATPLFYLVGKSCEEGAQTTIYGALERDDKLKKGAYYADCKVKNLESKQCEDPEAARKLWEISEKLLDVKFDI